MSVDSFHPAYALNFDRWSVCRDFYEGEDFVKSKGQKHLPKLKRHKAEDYDHYKQRASVYGAFPRTVDGMTGLAFRKSPQVVVPDSMEDFRLDVSLRNQDINDFVKQALRQMLTVNRGGFLVDMPAAPDGGNVVPITAARIERENLNRPRWIWYDAEQCTGWLERVGDNIYKLVRLQLMEVEEEQNDKFETIIQQRYRVCELDENGRYQQHIYHEIAPAQQDTLTRQTFITTGVADAAKRHIEHEERSSGTRTFELVSTIVPLMNGQPLDHIPWYQVCADDIGLDVAKPVLMDLAWLNQKHYQITADYYHGLFWVGLPTPWGTGIPEEEDPKTLGGGTAWFTSAADARFGMLEFTGSGLSNHREELARIEYKMAAIGARLLAPDDVIDATATSSNIKHLGETSILAIMCRSLSQTIRAALHFTTEWATGQEPAEDDVEYEINTDFFPMPLTAQELTAQIQAYQSGSIPFDQLWQNMQRGGVADPDVSADDAREMIENEGMSLGPKAKQDKADERYDDALEAQDREDEDEDAA